MTKVIQYFWEASTYNPQLSLSLSLSLSVYRVLQIFAIDMM